MIKNPYLISCSLAGLIVLMSFVLAFNSSLEESAIMDELAHIPAGYGYVKYFDYRLNPEHPPLVKVIAVLPLVIQDFFKTAPNKLKFPTDKSAWQKDINGQWESGTQFLYESGNDADKIIQWSRIGPMILMLLLIIFIYLWSKELIGHWWALLPTFLFGLSSVVLAHGHYVTTDIGAAFGIFIAVFYFIKFLLSPSQKYLIFAGLAFGISQLMKFSAVLLIPFFIFLLIIFCIWKINYSWPQITRFVGFKHFIFHILHYFKSLILIFFIGYALVYAFYFFLTINYPIEKQVKDTKIILTSFAGGPDKNFETCKLNFDTEIKRKLRCFAEINIWMAGNKIFRPFSQYFLGVLMVTQRSAGGNSAYFLDEVSSSGWWYYFPVVFVLKEPIPSLILIFFAFILAFWNIIRKVFSHFSFLISHFSNYLGTHFPEFSMIVFVLLYWLYSIKSPLNIGIRHILPTMPFIYILTASALKKWINKKTIADLSLNSFAKIRKFNLELIKKTLVGFLIVWYFAETLFVSPYFISYFNQFAKGTENGYRYVVDSNYDWGQDLKRLKNFVEKNKIDKIAVDYFGGGNPKYYLGEKAEIWQSSKGNPKIRTNADFAQTNINTNNIQNNIKDGLYEYASNQYESATKIEWLAISVNNIQNALGKLHPGQERNPKDEYQWLKEIKDPYKPDAKAGMSIFIYKL